MNAEQILAALMALPPDQRREIAVLALDSLAPPPDPELEDAWDAELRRRADAIEAGAVETYGHEESMDFIFGSLRKKAG